MIIKFANKFKREKRSITKTFDKMNNRDIELRLQNLVNSDKVVSKQLALKTKHLYRKLHFLGNTKL